MLLKKSIDKIQLSQVVTDSCSNELGRHTGKVKVRQVLLETGAPSGLKGERLHVPRANTHNMQESTFPGDSQGTQEAY